MDVGRRKRKEGLHSAARCVGKRRGERWFATRSAFSELGTNQRSPLPAAFCEVKLRLQLFIIFLLQAKRVTLNVR